MIPMRTSACGLLIALLFCSLCFAQNAQDEPPTPPTGSISGIVVRGDSGTPLSEAEVTIDSYGKNRGETVRFTGPDGRFTFTDLEAGTYSISAMHRRFISPVQSSAVAVSLNSNQQLRDVVFRLLPGAVVHGKVVDQDGEPLVGTRVKLLAAEYTRNMTRLEEVNHADVNDLGEYRIFGIQPGYYYIAAHAPGTAQDNAGSAVVQASRTTTFRRIYYDNVTSPRDAKRIHLIAGAEVSADFKIPKIRTATVRLTVVSTIYPAQEFQGYVGMMPAETYLGDSLIYKETREPMKATFKGVTPGRYIIGGLLGGKTEDGTEFLGVAAQETDIEEGANEITVPVTSLGTETIARVSFDSDNHPPYDGMNIGIVPLRGQFLILEEEKGHEESLDDSPEFKLQQRSGLTYALVLRDFKCPGCYIKSVRLNGKEALTTGVSSNDNGAHVEVTIATDGASISGRVLDSQDRPLPNSEVVALPDADHRRTFSCIGSDDTRHDGRFSISGLCPGSYSVVALPAEAPSGIFWEPDFARYAESLGLPITLAPNSNQALELHPIPLPQN